MGAGQIARNLPELTPTADEHCGGLHFSQDSRFLRPILTAEVLKVSGEIIGLRGSHPAAVVTIRDETWVCKELVAVSTSVSTLRSVTVSGTEHLEPSQPVGPKFTTGLASLSIFTLRRFRHLYSECAEIWNPIRTEHAFALAAGLDDILFHGRAL